MAEYLTEAAYQRWLRQYQTNLAFYIDALDQLRIRLDALPYEDEIAVQKIGNAVNEIDEQLDQAIPRNFNRNGEALAGGEMFVENMKVLINLIYRMRGKNDHFMGIYQSERSRVATVHHEYPFKEKLKQVREMIEALEVQKEEIGNTEATESAAPMVAG